MISWEVWLLQRGWSAGSLGDGVKKDKAEEDLILKGLIETQRCLLLFGTAHTNPNDQFRDICKWGLKKYLRR